MRTTISTAFPKVGDVWLYELEAKLYKAVILDTLPTTLPTKEYVICREVVSGGVPLTRKVGPLDAGLMLDPDEPLIVAHHDLVHACGRVPEGWLNALNQRITARPHRIDEAPELTQLLDKFSGSQEARNKRVLDGYIQRNTLAAPPQDGRTRPVKKEKVQRIDLKSLPDFWLKSRGAPATLMLKTIELIRRMSIDGLANCEVFTGSGRYLTGVRISYRYYLACVSAAKLPDEYKALSVGGLVPMEIIPMGEFKVVRDHYRRAKPDYAHRVKFEDAVAMHNLILAGETPESLQTMLESNTEETQIAIQPESTMTIETIEAAKLKANTPDYSHLMSRQDFIDMMNVDDKSVSRWVKVGRLTSAPAMSAKLLTSNAKKASKVKPLVVDEKMKALMEELDTFREKRDSREKAIAEVLLKTPAPADSVTKEVLAQPAKTGLGDAIAEAAQSAAAVLDVAPSESSEAEQDGDPEEVYARNEVSHNNLGKMARDQADVLRAAIRSNRQEADELSLEMQEHILRGNALFDRAESIRRQKIYLEEERLALALVVLQHS